MFSSMITELEAIVDGLIIECDHRLLSSSRSFPNNIQFITDRRE